MDKIFFKNRKVKEDSLFSVRETLLAVFYSNETSGKELQYFIDERAEFLSILFNSLNEETLDLIQDELHYIFDDVRFLNLEKQDEVEFNLPKIAKSFKFTFDELDNHNKNDNFFELTQKIGKDNRDKILAKEVEENIKHSKLSEEVIETVKNNVKFYSDFIDAYKNNVAVIDKELEKYSANWDFSRIAIIDKIILRMGVIEFNFFNDIPPKVTINESIELGKKYSTPKSKSFINGMLDKLQSYKIGT